MSVIDLPQLPKPTPMARSESITSSSTIPLADPSIPNSKPKKRVAQRKRTACGKVSKDIAPPTLETVLEPVPLVQQEELSPLAAKSAAAARPKSAAAVLQSKASTVPKKRAPPARPASPAKRLKMVDQCTQTQTQSGRDHTSALLGLPTSNVSVIDRDVPSPPPPPESYLKDIDKFIAKHKHRPPPQDIYNTPAYSAADPEKREMMLNDWICENLENPDFLKLCEDMEFSWRRTALTPLNQ
jgi:hypothetical protein